MCQIINDVLEKTNKARTDTGKLFHKLVKEEVVEKEEFVAGYVCLSVYNYDFNLYISSV